MRTMKRLYLLLICCLIHQALFSQLKPVYDFLQDDTLLRNRFYEDALAQENKLIASLGKEYKNDYKESYDNRFKTVSGLLQGHRTVTASEAHNYLQAILKKITD